MRKMAPVNLIVLAPKTEAGKEALAKRVSDVHAAAVNQRLRSLNCPNQQKLELLNAVIASFRTIGQEGPDRPDLSRHRAYGSVHGGSIA